MLSLDNVHLSPFDTPMFGSIVALNVQGYYCFRIYVLDKKALPIAIGIALVKLFPHVVRSKMILTLSQICIIQVVGGIYGGIQGYRAGAFSKVQLNIAALYVCYECAFLEFCVQYCRYRFILSVMLWLTSLLQ